MLRWIQLIFVGSTLILENVEKRDTLLNMGPLSLTPLTPHIELLVDIEFYIVINSHQVCDSTVNQQMDCYAAILNIVGHLLLQVPETYCRAKLCNLFIIHTMYFFY